MWIKFVMSWSSVKIENKLKYGYRSSLIFNKETAHRKLPHLITVKSLFGTVSVNIHT